MSNCQDYNVLYNNFLRLVICVDLHFTNMWQNLHDSIISLRGEVWAYTSSFTHPYVIRIPVSSKKIEPSYIYMCLVYQLSLCDFPIGYWNCSDSVIFFELFRQCDICLTVPTVWYLLSFILSLSCHVKFIIALCTVVVTYKSIYINQNIVIVNTNRNTKDLLFKSLISVYCFVDHFRLLVPFFHLVAVLSISLKEQFEDTKGGQNP